MVIFELLVSCAIPLCVISFTYTTTALYLKESSRSIPEGTQNPQLNTRRTTAKIVVGLTLVFMISYVPYHVRWTYVNYTKKQKAYFSIRTDSFFFERWTTIHISNLKMFSFIQFLSQSCSSVLYQFSVQTASQMLINLLLQNKFPSCWSRTYKKKMNL